MPPMAANSSSTEKALRLDFFVAIVALVISTIAAGASVYQTVAIHEQLSAQIWPYLDIGTTQDPAFYEIDLANDGLGPALIERVKIAYDGKVMNRDLSTVMAPEAKLLRAKAKSATERAKVQSATATLSSGDVLPAGHVRRLLRVAPGEFARFALAEQNKTSIEICYCSLLQQCWIMDSTKTGQQPAAVSNCS